MLYTIIIIVVIAITISLKLQGTSSSTEKVGDYKIESFKDGSVILKSCANTRRGKFFVPSKVTTIGFGAFSGCNMIEEIVLNPECKVIGQRAFENCSSLKRIEGRSSLEVIREFAFKGCKSLCNIYLGERIKSLEAHSFIDCESLSEIHIRTTFIPEVFESTFADVDKNKCVIYVMPGTKDLFSQAPIWNQFKIEEEKL